MIVYFSSIHLTVDVFFCFEYIIALLQQLFAVVTIETDGDFEEQRIL